MRRFLVYDNSLVEGCRLGYLDLINKENLAISVTRSVRASHFSHVMMTNKPPEKCFLAVKDSSYVFTLKQGDKRENNIKIPKGFEYANQDQVFYYIYAILFSNIFRKRYNEQLKSHFPRIPMPNNKTNVDSKEIFKKMSKYGEFLGKLHVKESEHLAVSSFNYNIGENLKIIEVYYESSEERIYFNNPKSNIKDKITWIGNITNKMWDFEIGSIKQIEQWLKSRKYVDPKKSHTKKPHHGLRRGLKDDEFNEFLELCYIIKKTLEIIPKIDEIYIKIDITK
jgi:predicted helicase